MEGEQMTQQLITDDVDVCVDCYMDHHEGRAMKDNSAVTWTDNTADGDDETAGITDFSAARCGCCHSTLAGARYRMAVWES